MRKGRHWALVVMMLIGCRIGFSETTVESKVAAATVYLRSALVTRVGEADLIEGRNELVFKGVGKNIRQDFINVYSNAKDGAITVLSANVKTEVVGKEDSAAQENELKKKLEEKKLKLKEVKKDIEVVDEKISFIKKTKDLIDYPNEAESAMSMPAVEDIKSLYVFYGAEFEGLSSKRLILNEEKAALENEIRQIEENLRQLGISNRREVLIDDIRASIECKKAGRYKFYVSYLVREASWQPEYRLVADTAKNKVSLVRYANVYQNTGETWQDVRLRFSTQIPRFSLNMPEVLVLRFYLAGMLKSKGSIQAAEHSDSFREDSDNALSWFSRTVGTSLDMESAGDMEPASPRPKQWEEAIHNSVGISTTYEPKSLVTLKGDGVSDKVFLLEEELDGEIARFVYPEKSTDVYMVANLKLKDQPVMPGPVVINTDGEYAGKINLAGPIGEGSDWVAPLGIDHGIEAKFIPVTDKSNTSGFFEVAMNKSTETKHYKIVITNNRKETVSVDVVGRVPLSQDESISIKLLKPSAKPDEEEYKSKKGVYLWKAQIAPMESFEVTYGWAVSYPKDKILRARESEY